MVPKRGFEPRRTIRPLDSESSASASSATSAKGMRCVVQQFSLWRYFLRVLVDSGECLIVFFIFSGDTPLSN